MEVRKIGVIGAGQMGHGIALVSAKAGFNVILRDIKEEYVKKGISKIERFLDKSIEKGRMTAEEKKKILSRIKGTTKLEDFKDVDLVIEAIFENVKVIIVFTKSIPVNWQKPINSLCYPIIINRRFE